MHDHFNPEPEELSLSDDGDDEVRPYEANDRYKAENDVLIEALARGATDEQAGRLIGRAARTVRRRRKEDAEFKAEEGRRRGEHLARLSGRAVDLGDRALETMAQALDDESPGIRLRAAQLILGSASRLNRATDFDSQATELRLIVESYKEWQQQLEEDQSDDDS